MPKTLLLADDSVTIQKVVGISFANEDVVLLTVDNGDDAIARAKEARPDVVLADVVMPGKNGYEVCQAIKSDPALAATPVLLLTGTFEAFDEQRAARAGADGHITKPFEAQALVDKVNALLSRPGAAPAPAPAAMPIGVLRPVRVEASPAEPASPTADTAYDFFDDEITAPRPDAGPREDTTVLLESAASEAGPFGGAFGFDEGDLAGPEPTPAATAFRPAPAGAAAPDAAELDADDASPFGEADRWDSPLETPAGRDETPGFGGEDLGIGLAPAAGSADADDASSLFEGSFPAAEPAVEDDLRGATRLLAESPEVEADSFDPGATRMAAAPPAPPAPLEALDELELDAALDGPSPFGEPVLDPGSARDYDVSSSDLGAPLAEPAPPPREPVPAPEPWSAAVDAGEPPAAEAFAHPAAAALDAAARSPSLGRDELRDMLEKMAWEAFGPLTERLVRDAVDRIERVAWEVIPQLAETLIREEIRKLKGE